MILSFEMFLLKPFTSISPNILRDCGHSCYLKSTSRWNDLQDRGIISPLRMGGNQVMI